MKLPSCRTKANGRVASKWQGPDAAFRRNGWYVDQLIVSVSAAVHRR